MEHAWFFVGVGLLLIIYSKILKMTQLIVQKEGQTGPWEL